MSSLRKLEITPHPALRTPHSKRLLDIVAAGLGLMLLSPLLVAIGVCVKSYDGGPVFYRAVRVGKDGRLLRLYKYRTMVVGADRMGPGITTSGDKRITPVGKWLRRTKLDELPQLINVLRGDMSLVGPRPEDPRYVALYTPAQRRVLSVKPGITSVASLTYRREESLLAGPEWETVYRNEILPTKLEMDLSEIAQANLWSDMRVIARTIVSIFD